MDQFAHREDNDKEHIAPYACIADKILHLIGGEILMCSRDFACNNKADNQDSCQDEAYVKGFE